MWAQKIHNSALCPVFIGPLSYRSQSILFPECEQSKVARVGCNPNGEVEMFELKVTLDNLLTFAGLVFVALQIRDATKQSKLGSQIQIQGINRELIAMGFSKPELFEIMDGKGTKKVNSMLERRYLQLWLNLLSLFHSLKEAGVLQKDYRESCERDLRDMFALPNMRRHWQEYGKYYPTSFQKSVNDILHEAGYGMAGGKPDKTTN